MATIRQEMAADLANAIALYEEDFEWNGDNYACVRRDRPTDLEIAEEGGWIEGVNASLLVSKAAFTGYNPDDTSTFPFIGALVNSGRHQVKQINGHKDPAALQLILYIGTVDA